MAVLSTAMTSVQVSRLVASEVDLGDGVPLHEVMKQTGLPRRNPVLRLRVPSRVVSVAIMVPHRNKTTYSEDRLACDSRNQLNEYRAVACVAELGGRQLRHVPASTTMSVWRSPSTSAG